jgi:hypothetical protein
MGNDYEDNKDETPSPPVEVEAPSVTPDDSPSTPAHEVVEDVHEQQAENQSEQIETD